MKNFKLLLSAAATFAMVACSSMDVDSEEVLKENYPADFVAEEYVQLHPELVRLQRADYVKAYNAKLEAAAKAGGDSAKAAYAAMMAKDDSLFGALDTAILHKMMVDPQIGGFSEEDWALDWETVVRDSLTAITTKDTLSLSFRDKIDTTIIQKVILKKDKDDEIGGKITYDAEGSIVSVFGFVGKEAVEMSELDVSEMELITKGKGLAPEIATDTLGFDTTKVTIPGGVSVVHLKALKKMNFYDTLDDYAAINAIELDMYALSYQYIAFGRSYGWAYRRCKDEEKGNVAFDASYTFTYPAVKLYCDDNGIVREIN